MKQIQIRFISLISEKIFLSETGAPYPGTKDPDPLPTDEMPKIFQLGEAQTVPALVNTVPTFLTIPKHPAPDVNVYNE